jgi:succinate dehydrogenase / fumarate reductase iron-sulfur subunit
MIVKIKRQSDAASESYWQSFQYDGPRHVPVSAILDALNYTDDLFDVDGNAAARIRWECSCMQSMCGGCAMVINGLPALACATFADTVKGEMLVLEPLSKFPVVADLIVDRSIIYKNLIDAKAYLDRIAENDRHPHKQQY